MRTVFDLAQIMPAKTSIGRKIVIITNSKNLTVYVPESGRWGGGRESKRITVNRFVLLDDLFFEGLGLWVGEGGRNKGLYFGNSSPALILRFLKFVENKLEVSREKFRITINSPTRKVDLKEKWSKILQIPIMNFTNVCLDTRTNREYAQIYLNSIVLAELMRNLQKKLELVTLSTEEYTISFFRGMFAAEGQVALRRPGSFHITFSSADPELVSFLKKCLQLVGINSGKYMPQSRKFPIYGYKNLKRFKELGIHTLHPEKRAKFELGFASYKRTNVLHGEEARALILQQLAQGPKTYDDLAAALGKARTTIQAWHIPILEKSGLIQRTGKRGQAWLFGLAEGKSSAPANS
jgi:hypothetical protein